MYRCRNCCLSGWCVIVVGELDKISDAGHSLHQIVTIFKGKLEHYIEKSAWLNGYVLGLFTLSKIGSEREKYQIQ